MEQIKNYLNSIVKEGKNFKSGEFQTKIQEDFMHSGIKFFINDSVAPFVFADEKHPLWKILAERCQEGANGLTATSNYNDKIIYYNLNKENFDGLNFAYFYGMKYPKTFKQHEKETYVKVFNAFKSILTGEGEDKKIGNGFERVGDISKTFELFKKAIVGLGEVDTNGNFKASQNRGESIDREFNMREYLIEENLSYFDNVCKEENYDKKNAICSCATLILLRAIAQKGEEDRIDDLAEELIPFASTALFKVSREFSDSELYEKALSLACDRLEKLNEGLDSKVYTASLKDLKADAKIFQEMRKTIDDQYFKDYNINFTNEGSNRKFSFINKDGKFEECKIDNKKVEAYRFLDNKIILSDSLCDTDEEVLATTFANLFMLVNSQDQGTISKNNLVEAFALPFVQAANKLGDDYANSIIKETIEKYNDYIKANKNEVVKNVLKSLEIDDKILDEIRVSASSVTTSTEITNVSVEEEVALPTVQAVIPAKGAATSKIDAKKVRKETIKSFSKIINQFSKKKTFSIINEKGKKTTVKLTPVKQETLRNVLGFLQDDRLTAGQKITGVTTASKYSEDALKITNIFTGDYLRDRVKKLEEISGGAEFTTEEKSRLKVSAKLSKKDIESFTKDNIARIDDSKTR